MKKFFIMGLTLVSFMATANDKTLSGVLIYEHGDSFGPDPQYHQLFYLQTEDRMIPLDASDAFQSQVPLHQWSGERVQIQLKQAFDPSRAKQAIQSIELLSGAARGGGIFGAQKWVSFLCKFSDKTAEPENEAFFDQMYANAPAGLDHYWRQVSYNNANVIGSVAFDWVTLPGTHTSYIPDPGNGTNADRNQLFADCTTTAINTYGGLDINDDFVGINMMFNDVLDCCAWGGGRYTSLDGGPAKLWRVTWNPPWAFANEGVIAHEMGHGFGLPHANNSDQDSNPYDSPWDVMSSATGYAVDDNVYGRLGKHINMEFKSNLGWVDDSVGFVAGPETDRELVFINHTALANLTANGYRFARIPLSNGTHYMLETRKAVGNYEANIPGEAVIIHHVSRCRSEPPWVVDADNPPANYSDNEGSMWKVGETFIDPIDEYEVYIAAEFALGFNVRISASDDLISRRGNEAVCFVN